MGLSPGFISVSTRSYSEMTTRKNKEKKIYPFEEEVNDLLSDIRSIPAHAKVKEIFLWELIRNATEALIDVRMESLVDKNKFSDLPAELVIRIVVDQKNHTLSVIDRGIGMTRDDFVSRLGGIYLCTRLNKYRRTINKYSTRDARVDLSRIYSGDGMYGLGLYSAYMVANKVVITTNKVGHDYQYVGEFDAITNVATLSVAAAARDTDRGTKVTLHLKKAHRGEYLNERKLQDLVKNYHKFLCPNYPVSILVLDENKKIPIEKEIVINDDYKEGEEEEWERIRGLFVKFIGLKLKKNVKVVVSDRVFDLPCNLSVDTLTFEINPRHAAIAAIKRSFEANPEDRDLKYAVLLQVGWCLSNFRAYDRRYGTSFYKNAEETLSVQVVVFSSSDEESDDESEYYEERKASTMRKASSRRILRLQIRKRKRSLL